MRVVIVGGNERMARQYEDICKAYGCKSQSIYKGKRFTEEKIGVSGSIDPAYQYGFTQDGH